MPSTLPRRRPWPKRIVSRPRRGCSSEVERQLPKLNVVGSIPIARSNNFNDVVIYCDGAV